MNATMLERPADARKLESMAAATASKPSGHWGRRLEDRQFAQMTSAFARTGGLLQDDAMVRMMRRHHGQPLSMLARWIISREVVSVRYGGQMLFPLFQFELSSMTRHPMLLPVLQELHCAFDDWDLATWFASPSEWLAGRTPVDIFVSDPSGLVQAARADRYIAMG